MSSHISQYDLKGTTSIARALDCKLFDLTTELNFCDKYGKMPVAIVGSNPSTQSPDCSAFHPDTKSRKIVDSWFKDENVVLYYFNIVPTKTEGNKQLTKKDMQPHLHRLQQLRNFTDNIVACGRIASIGLDMAGFKDHFKMPHPSGLNRFWNDKEAGEKKIKEMLSWIRRPRR